MSGQTVTFSPRGGPEVDDLVTPGGAQCVSGEAADVLLGGGGGTWTVLPLPTPAPPLLALRPIAEANGLQYPVVCVNK